MSKLFIHIGSHKTGTTSIQMSCRWNLIKTSQQRAAYINIRPTGTRIISSSGRQENFRADIDLAAADLILRPDRNGATSPVSRYITSDEEFFWISDPEPVHKLADLLKDRFSDITIVCYLRRQDLLAVSHRKQVSAGGTPAARFYGVTATPLPIIQDHFYRYFDYAAKLTDIWASAFGKNNIQLIPYERGQLVQGDVVEDFAHRTGLQFSPSEGIERNKSLEGDRTFVGLKLAELKVSKHKRQKILRGLPGVGRFEPSRQQAQEFLSRFEESNRRLAQEWTWQGAPFQFDASFDMYPETDRPQWGNTDVIRIVDAILSGAGSNR